MTTRTHQIWGALTLLTVFACTSITTSSEVRALEHPARQSCDSEIYAEIISPATSNNDAVEVRCRLSLNPTDVITKRIYLTGAGASDISIDCNGAVLDTARAGVNHRKPTIVIRSTKTSDDNWSVPRNLRVSGCNIKGSIRIEGMGFNGTFEDHRRSSFMKNHTRISQERAPENIFLDNLTISSNQVTPIYIGPGSSFITVKNSLISGNGNIALYLDAESTGNRILNNVFNFSTKKREVIAIDGSYRNLIQNNTFINPENGGIFLYRNCGERGVIRHHPPTNNIISHNTFIYTKNVIDRPAVWLNSREGKSSFCFNNPDFPFGSSKSSLDFAKFNKIIDNRIVGNKEIGISNNDPTNEITGNERFRGPQ